MRQVALYLRISVDRQGRAEGVAVQERQGREYAARVWPGVPVLVFSDNDLSAAKDDVVRPEYERLRQAIRDGQVEHVWTVEQSRIERLEVRWFEFAADMDAAGIADLHTSRDGIIVVRDEIAGFKAVFSAAEVRKLRRRVNDRMADNAAEGVAPGSKPWGYRHGVTPTGAKTYVIIPEQADAIRWAAAKVLAGWSLTHIETALRGRGLTGAHGGKLTPGGIRRSLTSPTIANLRVHRGEIVGPGNWPPILDEATWQAVRAKFAAPRTVALTGGGTYPVNPARASTGRRYVVTGGLAQCGVCGARLSGSLKQLGNGTSKPYLLCHPTNGGRACVGMMLPEVEEYVTNSLFAELDKPEFLDAIADDTHAGRREEIITGLAGVEGKRQELARQWAQPGGLSNTEWQAARAALAATERELRAELAAKPPPPARVDIARARSAWPSMSLDERREFTRLFIGRVIINRAQPGRRGFDSGRVLIIWKEAGPGL